MAYNSRLQLSGFSDLANNSPSTPLWSAALTWGNSASSNNGNLAQATYTHSGSGYSSPLVFTDSYSYDGLNRLQMASEVSNGTNEWSRGFNYDAYGNMWVSSPTGINPPGNTPQTNIYNGHNQISDGNNNYDAAGNQIFVNGNTLTYDAENRQVTNTSNATENYVYDGDGRRVQKWTSNSTTNYVYDAFGKLAAEYSTSTFTPECATCYVSADHLGSTRLVTDGSGAVMARHDYLPFGEEIGAQAGRGTQFAAYDVIEQKFTGKERDAESGLDYFGARYYGSALGRFTSPDEFKGGFDNLDGQAAFSPGPIGYADISDPQTLNKYVYTRNNPLRYVDPDGHDFLDYLSGVANAFISDNALGVGRTSGGNDDFRLGQVVGDGVAVITGSLEALGGGGEAVVTSPAAATGVGVVIPAAGAAVAAHGAATAAAGTINLLKAGGNFSPKTKQDVKTAADGKCQNCGAETTPGQQSKKGMTPPGNEGQTDHILPKSKGGSNDPSNAQHLCRDCKIKKSDKLPNQ